MPVVSELYYQSSGADGGGLPVVLIHGAGGNNLYWPPEVRRMQGQRIYALDLPGHGKSEGRGHQTIAGYAEKVLAWLEAMRLSRAVFIGHSMGGAVVQALAIHHPEQVLALGLVATGARLRVSSDILASSASQTTYHNAVKAICTNAFSESAEPRLIELAGQRMLENRASVLHGDLLACEGFDVMERVGSITQPAVVICGSGDKMTPMRYSQYLAGAIPKAELVVIPDAGHMVMLERPAEVAKALAAFINRLPDAG